MWGRAPSTCRAREKQGLNLHVCVCLCVDVSHLHTHVCTAHLHVPARDTGAQPQGNTHAARTRASTLHMRDTHADRRVCVDTRMAGVCLCSVHTQDGTEAGHSVSLTESWSGPFCTSSFLLELLKHLPRSLTMGSTELSPWVRSQVKGERPLGEGSGPEPVLRGAGLCDLGPFLIPQQGSLCSGIPVAPCVAQLTHTCGCSSPCGPQRREARAALRGPSVTQGARVCWGGDGCSLKGGPWGEGERSNGGVTRGEPRLWPPPPTPQNSF